MKNNADAGLNNSNKETYKNPPTKSDSIRAPSDPALVLKISVPLPNKTATRVQANGSEQRRDSKVSKSQKGPSTSNASGSQPAPSKSRKRKRKIVKSDEFIEDDSEDNSSDEDERKNEEGQSNPGEKKVIGPHRCTSCTYSKCQRHHIPNNRLLGLSKELYGLPKNQNFWVCFECVTAFPVEEKLKEHVKSHNNTNRVCPECAGSATSDVIMKQHLTKHSWTKYYWNICAMCPTFHYYKKEGQLLFHLKTKHTDIPMVYVCKKCKFGSCEELVFVEHVKLCYGLNVQFKKGSEPMHSKMAVMPTTTLSYQPDDEYFKLAEEHPDQIAPVSSCPERNSIRYGNGVFTCPEICKDKNGSHPCYVLTHFLFKKNQKLKVDHPVFEKNHKRSKPSSPCIYKDFEDHLVYRLIRKERTVPPPRKKENEGEREKVQKILEKIVIDAKTNQNEERRKDVIKSNYRMEEYPTNVLLREILSYDPTLVCFFCGNTHRNRLCPILRCDVRSLAASMMDAYQEHYANKYADEKLSKNEMRRILNFRLSIAGEKTCFDKRTPNQKFSVCSTHLKNRCPLEVHSPGLPVLIVPSYQKMSSLQKMKMELQKTHEASLTPSAPPLSSGSELPANAVDSRHDPWLQKNIECLQEAAALSKQSRLRKEMRETAPERPITKKEVIKHSPGKYTMRICRQPASTSSRSAPDVTSATRTSEVMVPSKTMPTNQVVDDRNQPSSSVPSAGSLIAQSERKFQSNSLHKKARVEDANSVLPSTNALSVVRNPYRDIPNLSTANDRLEASTFERLDGTTYETFAAPSTIINPTSFPTIFTDRTTSIPNTFTTMISNEHTPNSNYTTSALSEETGSNNTFSMLANTNREAVTTFINSATIEGSEPRRTNYVVQPNEPIPSTSLTDDSSQKPGEENEVRFRRPSVEIIAEFPCSNATNKQPGGAMRRRNVNRPHSPIDLSWLYSSQPLSSTGSSTTSTGGLESSTSTITNSQNDPQASLQRRPMLSQSQFTALGVERYVQKSVRNRNSISNKLLQSGETSGPAADNFEDQVWPQNSMTTHQHPINPLPRFEVPRISADSFDSRLNTQRNTEIHEHSRNFIMPLESSDTCANQPRSTIGADIPNTAALSTSIPITSGHPKSLIQSLENSSSSANQPHEFERSSVPSYATWILMTTGPPIDLMLDHSGNPVDSQGNTMALAPNDPTHLVQPLENDKMFSNQQQNPETTTVGEILRNNLSMDADNSQSFPLMQTSASPTMGFDHHGLLASSESGTSTMQTQQASTSSAEAQPETPPQLRILFGAYPINPASHWKVMKAPVGMSPFPQITRMPKHIQSYAHIRKRQLTRKCLCVICKLLKISFKQFEKNVMLQIPANVPNEWIHYLVKQLAGAGIQVTAGDVKKEMRKGLQVCVLHFNPHAYEVGTDSIDFVEMEHNAPMLNILNWNSFTNEFEILMLQFVQYLLHPKYSFGELRETHKNLKLAATCEHLGCGSLKTTTLSITLHMLHDWENVLFCGTCWTTAPWTYHNTAKCIANHLKTDHAASREQLARVERCVKRYYLDPCNKLKTHFAKAQALPMKFLCKICGILQNHLNLFISHYESQHVFKDGASPFCTRCKVSVDPEHFHQHWFPVVFPRNNLSNKQT